MSELKPCPFCGSVLHKPKRHNDTVTITSQQINCQWCGVKSVWFPTDKKAIDAWNTRPIEDALQARIAELESMSIDEFALLKHQQELGK